MSLVDEQLLSFFRLSHQKVGVESTLSGVGLSKGYTQLFFTFYRRGATVLCYPFT